MTGFDVCQIIECVYGMAVQLSNIVSGISKSGLWPSCVWEVFQNGIREV